MSQALGRSRGGYGTKVVAACDAAGRALAFLLAPGQASEVRLAPALLESLCALGPLGRVVCDRGYSSQPWRLAIQAVGAEACVPGQPTHPRAPRHDASAYARRHRIENLWARLKESRAVATRYDKTAASFEGGLLIAATLDLLSNRP
jgi:transposase